MAQLLRKLADLKEEWSSVPRAYNTNNQTMLLIRRKAGP